MQNKKVTEEVYTMLCHHETDDGGVKFVLADCAKNQSLQHKISQWGQGYICPYCAQMIQRACNIKDQDKSLCHHCEGDLQQFIISKQICEHANQTIREVKLVCINSKKDEPFIHTLDLGDKMICEACQRKLTYKYQDQDLCKICANKTKELLANIKGSLANQELRMIKRLIVLLSERKCADEVKAELEGHCVSRQPHNQHQKSCKIKDQGSFISKYEELNHKDNKFQFYTKCNKHKDIAISVCSTCVAVLLNINACPFGCDTHILNNVKTSKGKVTYSTGFVIFSPLIDPKHIHQHTLPMVVVQNITVAKKFDVSEVTSKNLTPGQGNQIKSQDYPTFGSVTKITSDNYILTGGITIKPGNQPNISQNVWSFTITEDKGQFKFVSTKLPNLLSPRCSHGSIVVNDQVYVIGGFDGKQYLSSCEKFNIKDQKWTSIGNLNYPRCKISVFPRTVQKAVQIVVLGGLSTSPEVYDYGQYYSVQEKQWKKIRVQTGSFGSYPFSSGRTSSTQHSSLAKYQNTLLFGGSNFQQYSNSIDEFISHNQKEKFVEFKEGGLSLQTKRSFAQIGVLDTNDKQKKKIVLFGGCLQHESVSNVELILVQIKNQKTITPIYSDVIGSKNLISELLQVDSQKYYKNIVCQLKESGKINQSQLKDADKPSSRHLLDTLWIAGKAVVNYALAAQK